MDNVTLPPISSTLSLKFSRAGPDLGQQRSVSMVSDFISWMASATFWGFKISDLRIVRRRMKVLGVSFPALFLHRRWNAWTWGYTLLPRQDLSWEESKDEEDVTLTSSQATEISFPDMHIRSSSILPILPFHYHPQHNHSFQSTQLFHSLYSCAVFYSVNKLISYYESHLPISHSHWTFLTIQSKCVSHSQPSFSSSL